VGICGLMIDFGIRTSDVYSSEIISYDITCRGDL
jgi:hypothetical protein